MSPGTSPNPNLNSLSSFERALRDLETPVFTKKPTIWIGRTVKYIAYASAFMVGTAVAGIVAGFCALAVTALIFTAINNRFVTKTSTETLRSIYEQMQRKTQAKSTSLEEMDEMIGLENVKKQLQSIKDTISIDLLRQKKGLRTSADSYHMQFIGNPGTGKTETATRMGRILFELGAIRENKVIMADRNDLVSQYLGCSGLKTEKLVNKAIGGVLFIDEAYSLGRKEQEEQPNNNYSKEALETLLLKMEKHKDDLVVIFAGYPEEMKTMISSNPGLRSRIPYTIHFDDYSEDQLAQIFKYFCDTSDYTLSDATLTQVREKLSRAKAAQNKKGFGNAREVRTLFEKIKHTQHSRLIRTRTDETEFSKEALMELTSDDIENTPIEEQEPGQGNDHLHNMPENVQRLFPQLTTTHGSENPTDSKSSTPAMEPNSNYRRRRLCSI